MMHTLPTNRYTTMQPQHVQDWIVSHNHDYAMVRRRLENVRDIVLHGSIEDSTQVLERAYVNAVLSIKTAKDRHENAFAGYYTGSLSLKEAALETVYGGNKKRWLRETFDSVNWRNVAIAIRTHVKNGRYAELLEGITDNLKGVGYRKGAFMLAMSGIYEYMCIDSNVANFAGLEENNNGKTLSFEDAENYLSVCDEIRKTTVNGNPYLVPFIVQWAIYDAERGEHARHMVYFNEVLE